MKSYKSKSFKFFNNKGDVILTMKYPFKVATDAASQKVNDFIIQELDGSASHCELQDINFKMINDVFCEHTSLAFCKFHDGLC